MDWGKIIALEDSDEQIPIDEHFKLIAGPGAGKTRFLINHILHVLKDSKRLKNGCKILCITHTNIAIDTIKSRLNNTINEVEVSTIHSFLYEHVVGPYLWTLNEDFDIDFFNLTYVGEIFPSFSLVPEPNRFYMPKDEYYKLKSIYWDFDDSELVLKSKYGFQYSFREEFKFNCWKNGKLSHDDVLYFAYKILKKNSGIVDILRVKFPYVFIDEFQDISNLQFNILQLIFQESVIVGFVGDPAQSIYSFQGANMKLFLDNCTHLKVYTIENNFRSTPKIVRVLNGIRNDNLINQKSMREDGEGNAPTILVGSSLFANNYAQSSVDPLYVLSYTHDYLNKLRFEINGIECQFNDNFKSFLNFQDQSRRNSRVIGVIKAIEYFLDFDIPNALNSINFAYRQTIYEDNQEYLLKKVFSLSTFFHDFYNLTATEFYNNFIYEKHIGEFAKITRGDVKDCFDSIEYKDILVNIKDNNSEFFRTIHSCKGDEFDSVLLLLENEDDLNFILHPNILSIEKHRRHYVAISRAKNNLFINVPSLNESEVNHIHEKGFKIIFEEN